MKISKIIKTCYENQKVLVSTCLFKEPMVGFEELKVSFKELKVGLEELKVSFKELKVSFKENKVSLCLLKLTAVNMVKEQEHK